MAANFPTLNKLAPGITFETPPMYYANFFSGGEQKLFLSLFSPDGENQDPFFNPTFSSLA